MLRLAALREAVVPWLAALEKVTPGILAIGWRFDVELTPPVRFPAAFAPLASVAATVCTAPLAADPMPRVVPPTRLPAPPAAWVAPPTRPPPKPPPPDARPPAGAPPPTGPDAAERSSVGFRAAAGAASEVSVVWTGISRPSCRMARSRLKARCEVLSALDFALTSVTCPTSFVPLGSRVPSVSTAALVVFAKT